MRIEIHGKNLPISDELRSHAQIRVWLAAQHHAHRIAWISILLTEHSGEGEPCRHTCTVVAGLKPGNTIEIHHTHPDLFAAVELACARLKQTLAHRLPQPPITDSAAEMPWDLTPEGFVAYPS